jgi:low molecular weight protein-tyrosine phosphatase
MSSSPIAVSNVDLAASLFEVVFICTGNRFRSPIAAAAFAAATGGQPVVTHSIGTLDTTGVGVLPEAMRLGLSYGLDLSDHRSRSLVNHGLADADLVVGFEEKHVARAVIDGGAPRDRSFLLVELVESLRDCGAPGLTDPVERARQLVARAAERRADQTTSMTISDPYGTSEEQYRRTAERVRDLAARLAFLLFGQDRR